MPNTLDETQENGLFALLKGASGSGKSVAALSFPNPYVFDYDFKMPAIARKHFPKKSIDYDTYSDTSQISDRILAWLTCPKCGLSEKCIKDGGNCESSCQYETLIHDSLTNLQNLIIRTVAQTKSESIPDMLKTLLSKKSKKTEMMDFDYYSAEVRFTEWLLLHNKILWSRKGNPKNIVFTAHVMSSENKNIVTNVTTVTRSIVAQGKKVGAFIPTVFDEVYMFGFSNTGGTDINDPLKTKHYALTTPTGEDDAKTAYRLTSSIDFTDGNFYDMLQAQINGQKFQASL